MGWWMGCFALGGRSLNLGRVNIVDGGRSPLRRRCRGQFCDVLSGKIPSFLRKALKRANFFSEDQGFEVLGKKPEDEDPIVFEGCDSCSALPADLASNRIKPLLCRPCEPLKCP